jgi:MoxR-like ATPase
MSYQDVASALGVAIGAKVPVILWGAPGQGKTSVLEAIAKETKRDITTILASIREPSDFAGLPHIVEGRTKLIAPDWAQDIRDAGGKGILFFDEISTAPPATQAAMLRVALDRVVGDLYLGDDVSIVAAANPPEIAADGWDLAAPMANRFCHLDWHLPADVVRDGFANGWAPVRVPTPDAEDVKNATREARLLVAAFLNARPDTVTIMPKATAEAGRAFPTPRSWEMAATLLGFATAAKSSAFTRRTLIAGVIGVGTAGEFLSYIDELDLPDPEDLLANPEKFEAPTRGDKVYAIGASVLAIVRENNTPERWKAAGRLIAIIAKSNHSDVAVAIGKRWMTIRPSESVMPDAESLKALAPILKEAKII